MTTTNRKPVVPAGTTHTRMIAVIGRRRWAQIRRSAAVKDPIGDAAEWKQVVLRPLAEHVAQHPECGGLFTEALAVLLLGSNAPLAIRIARTADSKARRSQRNDSEHEIVSYCYSQTWAAISAIDWQRWETWPGLLACKVRNAPADALRSVDHLSRSERNGVRRSASAVETFVQANRREPTPSERSVIVEQARLAVGLETNRRRCVISPDSVTSLSQNDNLDRGSWDEAPATSLPGWESDAVHVDEMVISYLRAAQVREAVATHDATGKLMLWLDEASGHNRTPPRDLLVSTRRNLDQIRCSLAG